MNITVNDFVNAIADRLKSIYPDYDIYTDKIKQEQQLSNYFFINVISVEQTKKLGNRCERTYMFDVFYFQDENKNINFFNWTENMMIHFKYLKVGEELYHVRDIAFDKATGLDEADKVAHFTFSIKFYTIEIQEKDIMDNLILESGLKYE